MAGKFALLLGNDQYRDEKFASLTVPRHDVEALKSALEDPTIGGFDQVNVLPNGSLEEIMAAIGELFANKNKDDLLLLYFSGHGAKDGSGQLYLVASQTHHKKLSSTAIWSSFIKNEMNQSKSRRQVLILDCCYSGAFGRDSSGAKSAIGAHAINQRTFDVNGYGREILVSSSAVQLSWEGQKVIDKTDKSLFTHYLVEGLNTGKAAIEGKQDITVEQLYDYVYGKVVNAAANMTPQRWVDKQQGSIIIAKNPCPQNTARPIPEKLLDALKSDQAFIREGAVRELGRIISRNDISLSNAAVDILKSMQNTERDRYVWKTIEQELASSVSVMASTETPTTKKKKDSLQNKQEYKSAKVNVSRAGAQNSQSENLTASLKPDTDKIRGSRSFLNITVLFLLIGLFVYVQPLNFDDSTISLIKKNIKSGKVFQDVLKDGSKGPKMVVIPAGSFIMGADKSDKDSSDDERPAHQVNIINPFAMGKYEVTVDQFNKFVAAIGYKTEAEISGGCSGENDENWRNPGFKQDDQHPIVCVSWNDAKAYIKWLNEQTEKSYRLPTEAEWEYARLSKGGL